MAVFCHKARCNCATITVRSASACRAAAGRDKPHRYIFRIHALQAESLSLDLNTTNAVARLMKHLNEIDSAAYNYWSLQTEISQRRPRTPVLEARSPHRSKAFENGAVYNAPLATYRSSNR